MHTSHTSISSGVLLRLLDRLQETHIPLHSLHILHQGRTALEAYYAPCYKGQLHRMFSVSKSLTALAVLKLCETGRISPGDSICDYFPEYLTENTHPWIRQTTIRDMLMMRSCHASTTYKFNMEQDWVESFFTVMPTHKPGTVFHYDTSASHTLCALAEKLTGRPMLDYLKDVLLREMGWSEDSYMLTDPFGHSLGGSGLMATAEDLVLLGQLLLQEGRFHGRQLLPKELLTEALSWQSATAVTGPIASECQGYGWFFWCGEHGARVCYGMGGQLILCYPAHELLVVTTADTQGMNGANQLIYEAIHEILLPAPGISAAGISTPDITAAKAPGAAMTDDPDRAVLEQRLSRLAIEPVSSVFARGCSPRLQAQPQPAAASSTLPVNFLDPRTGGSRISGQTYRIQGESSFTGLSLELTADSGLLRYTLDGTDCRLPFGLSRVVPCRFPVYNMFCASSGMWLDEHTFYIRTHLLDTSVGSIHFQLYFGEDDVTVFLKKQEETLFGEYSGHLYGIRS